MLHLLGGPARCGKTTLASRAAGARGLGWLSTDVVRGVVNLHMPLMRSEGFDVSHLAEADRFFPSFERLIESSASLAEVYVIEGVGLYPRHVERLGAHIERRAVFVGQSRVDLDALVSTRVATPGTASWTRARWPSCPRGSSSGARSRLDEVERQLF